MENCRFYGKKDIDLVLVHGGPGARGELKDLALLLSEDFGIMEVNQSQVTIGALVDELHYYIKRHCKKKIVLLGHSWGAWLIVCYAVKYPKSVKKLILVSSGSFQEQYVKEFNERRMGRLQVADESYFNELMEKFTSDELQNKDGVMKEFGLFMAKLDTYAYIDDIKDQLEYVAPNYLMFNAIWKEADALRRSGKLMELVTLLNHPIHIIQGDYDSHQLNGIVEPFDNENICYSYDLLKKCGHYPWREKYAISSFVECIKRQLQG